MSSPTKPDAGDGAGKSQLLALELTAEEVSWVIRYFSAIRRVEQKMADEANSMFVRAAEGLAEQHPRHTAPRLRLVTGGAK